jgi:hypothetical protein
VRTATGRIHRSFDEPAPPLRRAGATVGAVTSSEQRHPSPDRFRLRVDGIEFDVAYDESQPGAYHYTRRTPPAAGYGFTARRSDHVRSTMAEHEAAVRDFLAQVDPDTGYIEDDA